MLLLYAEDQAGLQTLADRHAGSAALQAAGLAEVQRLDTSLLDGTEPFGFRDGISQPLIAELEATRPARISPAHRACR